MRRIVIATLIGLSVFVVSLVVFARVVVWLYKATGNWDSEGAEIGLYPALIAITASVLATAFVVRLYLRSTRTHRSG